MIKLKRQRKPGTIEDALLIQWRAVKAAEQGLYAAPDVPGVLRAVHAITQAAAGYSKLLEAHQLEDRVSAIEEALEKRKGPAPAAPYRPAYA